MVWTKTTKALGVWAPNLQPCLPNSEFRPSLTVPQWMCSCETTHSPAQCFGIVGICCMQTGPSSPHPYYATQHIHDPQTDLRHQGPNEQSHEGRPTKYLCCHRY